MSQKLVAEYRARLAEIRAALANPSESQLREPFKDLLKTRARQRNLVFIAEYPMITRQKKEIKVDGAILHSLRVPLGFWEAKDHKDKLDKEIDAKFRAGYPQSNIIFDDTRHAVLVQNKEEVMRARMDDAEAVVELLDLFFGYETPEIEDFRKAVQQFGHDLPTITKTLNDMIETAATNNAAFRMAEAKFLGHAKDTINPAITLVDVREMLMQHILTEEIFANVFDQADFHRDNNIAKELYALEATFFKGALKHDTLQALKPYYSVIKSTAAQITSHAEKQKFLKTIYENFYKVYNPKAADRLGVIYTPNEIVRFMVDGADWLCRKHFGKALMDDGVDILDPATGTGTFICELLDSFRGYPDRLREKYKAELHANEVAILPYYVANLNIEATYYALAGQYAEFENLCFVDTLDNVEGLGKFSGHQYELLGAMSEVNIERIRRQNKRKISVIIGNPPYNANQQNESDDNKNRKYDEVDQRIKDTYIKESTAQKTKQYDMFVRFIRWASDRIDSEGILAFIVNRKFIDGRNFDGFRRITEKEFAEFLILDLGGDYKSKDIGGGGNVFGIGTGVAIFFAIKVKKIKKQKALGDIKYFYSHGYSGDEKLSWLSSIKFSEIQFSNIRPDQNAYWLENSESDWSSFTPIISKDVKLKKAGSQGKAIFELFSLGLASNRDEWVYDFSESSLLKKIHSFCDSYLSSLHKSETAIHDVVKIKWTRELKLARDRAINIHFSPTKLKIATYRPFVSKHVYYDQFIIHCRYKLNETISEFASNFYILIPAGGTHGRITFSVLSSPYLPDLNFMTPCPIQALPMFRYNSNGERIENITDWALEQFRTHYASVRGVNADAIGKDDIFHYVYGVLHDPVYREKYALNLKREFPRIPFYSDFIRWRDWGQRLMELHINFEIVDPFALTRIDAPDIKARDAGLKPKPVLKPIPDKGIIIIDSETQLSGIPPEAWAYRLGNRAALDWILDQYKEKTPKDPTIREKFNTYRFADYKEKVIDLLARVTTVSLETVAITRAMAALKRNMD